MDSASQKMTCVISKQHNKNKDPASWRGKLEPNYTSSGCMLIQVDWGGKLRVNHINECMPSEVDWGAHETHQMDTASLKMIGEVMIQVFTLWMDACSLKLIGEPMIQVSSFTLCSLIMMQTKGFLHPRTVGRTKQRTSSTPVIEFWTFI